jgi:D-xylose transport system substrate-binding protein
MTIFKNTGDIGRKAIDMAIQIAKGEKVDTNATVDNGVVEVPSVLLDPYVVDKDNTQILIDAGYLTEDDLK